MKRIKSSGRRDSKSTTQGAENDDQNLPVQPPAGQQREGLAHPPDEGNPSTANVGQVRSPSKLPLKKRPRSRYAMDGKGQSSGPLKSGNERGVGVRTRSATGLKNVERGQDGKEKSYLDGTDSSSSEDESEEDPSHRRSTCKPAGSSKKYKRYEDDEEYKGSARRSARLNNRRRSARHQSVKVGEDW